MDEYDVARDAGRRLRETRKKHHISRATLAEAANYSKESIIKYEQGVRPMSMTTIYGMAKVTGESVYHLLGLPEEEAKQHLILLIKEYIGNLTTEEFLRQFVIPAKEDLERREKETTQKGTNTMSKENVNRNRTETVMNEELKTNTTEDTMDNVLEQDGRAQDALFAGLKTTSDIIEATDRIVGGYTPERTPVVAAARMLCNAIIAYLFCFICEKDQNLDSALKMLGWTDISEDGTHLWCQTDHMLNGIEKEMPGHFACRQYGLFKLGSVSTRKDACLLLADAMTNYMKDIGEFDGKELQHGEG